MDVVTLSRLQFALTTIYHWLFVPLTLGMGWFVAFMQTGYYQTRDETWRKMAKFWGKLFLINFTIGVVTGIVQEFQFGMNWSAIVGSSTLIDGSGSEVSVSRRVSPILISEKPAIRTMSPAKASSISDISSECIRTRRGIFTFLPPAETL